jgi:antitoxin component of MazEF toxin-antitoxin module
MVGVLELESVKAQGNSIKDTWLLRLPKDICDKEGFSEGTLVSLTIKDGGIQSSFVQAPRKEIKEISQRLLEKNSELYRRLEEIGD